MAFQIEFNYTHESGNVISLADWIQTQPTEQQEAFTAALNRNNGIFIEAIENGKLTIVDSNQVWASEEDQIATKCDEEFAVFFDRYISENKITFTTQNKTV